MSEATKGLVRGWFVEMNRGNLAAADQYYAANYVLHDTNVPPGLPPGPEGVRQFLSPMFAAFPDGQASLDDMVAEGDRVVVRYTIRGTHTGLLMGIPASGRAVVVPALSIAGRER